MFDPGGVAELSPGVASGRPGVGAAIPLHPDGVLEHSPSQSELFNRIFPGGNQELQLVEML